MSYQYPSPQDGTEIDMPHASYMAGYPAPTTSTLEVRLCTASPPSIASIITTSSPLCQRSAQGNQIVPDQRRESLSKESKLKRSFSAPNVRPQGTNEDDHGPLGLPNEKKRNKLGYHRTPIACVWYRALSAKEDQMQTAGDTRRSGTM
ncbi:hypothetical protein AAE478_001989 [Parahypoxylon ruwenzoriense]